MSIEQDFVACFVDRSKRERWTAGLENPRRRPKLLTRVSDNGQDWDPRHVIRLQLTGKRPEQIESIIAALRTRGAGDSVYVIARYDEHDGQDMPLDQAIELFVDYGEALLICTPTLALHFPEAPLAPLLLWRK